MDISVGRIEYLFARHNSFEVSQVARRVDGLDQGTVRFVPPGLDLAILVLQVGVNLTTLGALRQLPYVRISLLADRRLRKELLRGVVLVGFYTSAGHFELS